MNKKKVVSILILVALGVFAAGILYLRHIHVAVLSPSGEIGHKERSLMVTALALSLIVIIPVFTLLGVIIWKYRASNTDARYTPNWDGSHILETIWWIVPGLLILVLSVITWKSSHQLDPYKPLASNVQPINVEVVSLDWKWLFIYPDQHIATMNYLQFPANTPVNFRLTSDTVMNSFWIPKLGGQIYTMPGMSTQLHLMADTPGTYRGMSANISGSGFAGMDFTAKSTTKAEFNAWVKSIQVSKQILDNNTYNKLAAHTKNAPITTYAVREDPYDTIVMKYMGMGNDAMTMDGAMNSMSMQPAQSTQAPESKSTSTMPQMNMQGMKM